MLLSIGMLYIRRLASLILFVNPKKYTSIHGKDSNLDLVGKLEHNGTIGTQNIAHTGKIKYFQ